MKSISFFILLSKLLCLLTFTSAQNAPYDPSPFQIIGDINGLTLDTAGGTLAGGSITVDGIKITVPKNLLATLPSITVAWAELFDAAGTPQLPGFGGVSWQATVLGNRVNNNHIAGMVYIAQQANRVLQGFVNSIDPATGHFRVTGNFGADAGTTGIDCFLNDPTGRFAVAYTANPLWTLDPDNPSIHTTTGFPMCIPRNASDPGCPAKNRPIDPATNRASNKITFKDPTAVGPTDPDPRLAMPLAVGDYITFSGTTIGGSMAVYALDANIGAYTAPGSKPAYVTVESAIYAVVTNQGGEIAETRSVAFTTDPSTILKWFAMDVDPCTGAVTERPLLQMLPNQAAPLGRAVYRLGKTDVSPATRQVGFRLSTGTAPGAGGVLAGQFIQPIFDFVFPELLTFGDPMFPLLFEVIPFLAKGGGPFVPGNPLATPPTTPTIVGQLSPWPGANAPVPTVCPATPVPPPTTTAPATTPTPPVADIVTIITATQQNKQGATSVSVTASTNNLSALLTLKITANINIPPAAMNNLGNGRFSLTLNAKGAKVTAVTVTSNAGGSATQPV